MILIHRVKPSFIHMICASIHLHARRLYMTLCMHIYDYVCVYICICIGKCNFSYKIDIALTHKSVAVAQRA